MGLESGTWVSDLVTTNPAVSDQEAQGANHLQLIKSVLQNTFPNASRAFPFPVSVGQTSNFPILKSDFNKTFVVDTTGGAVTMALPTLASADAGWNCRGFKKSSDSNAMVVAPPSGTINGSASLSSTVQYSGFLIFWDGSAFWNVLPLSSIANGSITSAMLAAGAVTNAAIAANAVALSNLATQADQTILANISGGAATPTAASLSAIIDEMLGNTQGAILYRDSSLWKLLAPGTSGQFLETQGGSANPQWASQNYQLLNTLTAANSAVLSDTTSFTGAYSCYEVVFENLIPATDAVSCAIQIHSGGSFKTTGYLAHAFYTASNASSALQGSTTNVPLGILTDIHNVAPGISGTLRVFNPSANSIAQILGSSICVVPGGVEAVSTFGGYWNTAGVVDGFQIAFSSGNISTGKIKIFGIL